MQMPTQKGAARMAISRLVAVALAGKVAHRWGLEPRWGAVATADGALGVAAGQESQESAEQHALAHCQTHSEGKVCKVLIAYYNQCVAVAWGDGGSLWARSPGVYDAEATALSNCQKSTTNCDIYYSACSYAERVQ